MRRFILLLGCAGLLLAACSDDNTSAAYDTGTDLAAGKDKGPVGADWQRTDGHTPPDGPLAKKDGPAVKPDGPLTKPDGPTVKPDGPAVKPDGPLTKPDGGQASCKAMDVLGVGMCKMILGHYWDGSGCKSLTGCSCSGTDCARLYPSSSACQTAHAHCSKPKCSAWDAKGVGMCSMFLGYIWDGKACKGISGCSCGGADCKNIYSSPTTCAAGQAHCP